MAHIESAPPSPLMPIGRTERCASKSAVLTGPLVIRHAGQEHVAVFGFSNDSALRIPR